MFARGKMKQAELNFVAQLPGILQGTRQVPGMLQFQVERGIHGRISGTQRCFAVRAMNYSTADIEMYIA